MTYETTIRTSGYNKKIFVKETHGSLASAVEWILKQMPGCELQTGRFESNGEKYGAIVLREGHNGIVTSTIGFYK